MRPTRKRQPAAPFAPPPSLSFFNLNKVQFYRRRPAENRYQDPNFPLFRAYFFDRAVKILEGTINTLYRFPDLQQDLRLALERPSLQLFGDLADLRSRYLATRA